MLTRKDKTEIIKSEFQKYYDTFFNHLREQDADYVIARAHQVLVLEEVMQFISELRFLNDEEIDDILSISNHEDISGLVEELNTDAFEEFSAEFQNECSFYIDRAVRRRSLLKHQVAED